MGPAVPVAFQDSPRQVRQVAAEVLRMVAAAAVVAVAALDVPETDNRTAAVWEQGPVALLLQKRNVNGNTSSERRVFADPWKRRFKFKNTHGDQAAFRIEHRAVRWDQHQWALPADAVGRVPVGRP